MLLNLNLLYSWLLAVALIWLFFSIFCKCAFSSFPPAPPLNVARSELEIWKSEAGIKKKSSAKAGIIKVVLHSEVKNKHNFLSASSWSKASLHYLFHEFPPCSSIQRLKDEIAEVTNEIENLGSTEERWVLMEKWEDEIWWHFTIFGMNIGKKEVITLPKSLICWK